MKKTISQCMIVKNEENNIRHALSWGKEIMCEQIVVDTGSTDRTVEIAQEMGAKVFYFPWINDFSAAKNYAIEQAKGDWIAFLDADESFAPEDVPKIPAILEVLSEDVDGLMTGWMQLDEENYISDGGTQIRIFANRPLLRYKGKIHENLVRLDNRKLKVVELTDKLAIFHTGYRESVMELKSKGERYRKLIREKIEEDPQNHIYWGYLGESYGAEGKWQEAEKAYQCAIKWMPAILSPNDQRSAYTYVNYLFTCQVLGRSEEEIESIYREAVTRLPQESDFDCVMGMWCWDRQKEVQAITYFERAIKKLEKYGSYNKALKTTGKLIEIYHCLGKAYQKCGNTRQAVHYCMVVLNSDRYDISALLTLLSCFMLQNVSAQEVFQFLEKLYNYSDIKDKILLRRMAIEVNWKELEKLYKGIFLPQERAQFEAAMETAQSGAPLS